AGDRRRARPVRADEAVAADGGGDPRGGAAGAARREPRRAGGAAGTGGAHAGEVPARAPPVVVRHPSRMTRTPAYAAAAAAKPLAPFAVDRRAPGPRDVALDVLFCGICHSDIHQARDEWGGSIFPMVPGHEIVGRVTASPSGKFRKGELVGIGC